MAYSIIKNGSNYNHGVSHREYQIDSLATDSIEDIQVELATLPECAPGSTAINASLDLICVKGNDGEWVINR
jgi:hypothetical protein